MNYQIYKLKRKMQRWLYSIEDIIYFPTRELFDKSPAFRQWLKDRDKNKTHYRNIKRITQEIFQAVQVKGYALICTANLSHYSLKYYFDTCSKDGNEVREIMRTPKWGKKKWIDSIFCCCFGFWIYCANVWSIWIWWCWKIRVTKITR